MKDNVKILVFVTHPDDETLIAGCILKRLGTKSEILVVSSCTGNNRRDIAFHENGKQYGYDTKILNYDGCMLVPNIHKLATDMNDIIKEYLPDIIIGNHFIDSHQDHKANHKAMKIATDPSRLKIKCKVILGYGPSLYEFSRLYVPPNLFVEVTGEEVEYKTRMMEKYKNEVKPGRDREAIYLKARQFGILFGVEFAEAFYLQSGEILL